jgi:hypothetical protein
MDDTTNPGDAMTQSLQIESRVGTDGVLTLRVPLAASDANTDVIVTIRPKSTAAVRSAASAWPPGYFEKTYGSFASDPLAIPEDPVPAPEAVE